MTFDEHVKGAVDAGVLVDSSARWMDEPSMDKSKGERINALKWFSQEREGNWENSAAEGVE